MRKSFPSLSQEVTNVMGAPAGKISFSFRNRRAQVLLELTVENRLPEGTMQATPNFQPRDLALILKSLTVKKTDNEALLEIYERC